MGKIYCFIIAEKLDTSKQKLAHMETLSKRLPVIFSLKRIINEHSDFDGVATQTFSRA